MLKTALHDKLKNAENLKIHTKSWSNEERDGVGEVKSFARNSWNLNIKKIQTPNNSEHWRTQMLNIRFLSQKCVNSFQHRNRCTRLTMNNVCDHSWSYRFEIHPAEKFAQLFPVVLFSIETVSIVKRVHLNVLSVVSRKYFSNKKSIRKISKIVENKIASLVENKN
jgi:hypothetical protein